MKKSLLALFVSAVCAPALMAFNPQPDPPAFAMIGIVSSQTARLNLYARVSAGLVAPGPCDGVVQLRFFDEAGNNLAHKTVRVTNNLTDFIEFTPPRDVAAAMRVEIRGDISWVTVQPGPCRPSLFGNVEVYSNTTGQTLFVLPAVQDVPAVQGQQ